MSDFNLSQGTEDAIGTSLPSVTATTAPSGTTGRAEVMTDVETVEVSIETQVETLYAQVQTLAATVATHTTEIAALQGSVSPSGSAPVFTADTPPTGTVGSSYSYQFTATESPTAWAVASGALPTGLALNPTTGLLSGTPATAATYTFSVSAANTAGATNTPTLTVQVVAASLQQPVFNAASPPAGTVSAAYSYQFSATNNPTSFAVASGTIPAGLTFNTSTGILSGTPTTAASYSFTISATNTGGTTSTGILTVTIAAAATVAPANTAAPTITGSAVVGDVLTATTGTWSNSPVTYTYQWKAGGTAISGASGTFTGTTTTYVPVAAEVGEAITVTVTATNAAGSNSATSSGTSAVTSPASAYKTTVLADSPSALWMLNETSGTVAADATGNGHTGAYTGTYTLGATSIIPSDTADTALSGAGATGVSGVTGTAAVQTTTAAWSLELWLKTPATQTGVEMFVYNGTDAAGYGVGWGAAYDVSATTAIVLFGNAGWQPVGPTLTVSTVYHLVVTCTGTTLSYYLNGVLSSTVTASNAPLTPAAGWSVGCEQGITSANSRAFTGTMQAAAIYPTALTGAQVANHYAAGSTGGVAKPMFTADTPPAGSVGATYSYQFAASNSPTSWAVASGTLPAGLSLSTSTGLLSGTLTTSQTATFAVSATNSAGTTTTPTLTVTVTSSANAFLGDASDFEGSAGGWTEAYDMTTATVAQSTAEAHTGTHSLAVTTTTAGTTGTNSSVTYPSNITASTPLTVSFYDYAATARSGTITVGWFTGAGAGSTNPTYLSSSTPANFTETANTWIQASTGALTPPAGANAFNVTITWTGTALNEVHYIDTVSATLSGAATVTTPVYNSGAVITDSTSSGTFAVGDVVAVAPASWSWS